MKKMVRVLSGGNLVRATAACLLVLALLPHRYSYFTILRWVVCAAAAYSAMEARQVHRAGFAWLCVVLALFFNPLLPVHLDRGTWEVVDLLAAGSLAVASVALSRAKEDVRTGGE